MRLLPGWRRRLLRLPRFSRWRPAALPAQLALPILRLHRKETDRPQRSHFQRVGLWARTLDDAGGVWVQADRGALPAQAVFLVGSERDRYHAGEPANDARFITVFAHALEHTGGYAPEEARRMAGTMLPDMLSYDPTRPASFPSNGRTLTDDAADAFLAVLTNGKVTGDKVGPHIDLLAEFPYVGPPHNISVPSHATSPVATELRKASRRLGSS